MTHILKPLALEAVCNTVTTNTYNAATLVRVTTIGSSTGGHLVTCYYANNSAKYSISVVGGQEVLLVKNPTDYLSSNATDSSVQVVPVAFTGA